MNKKIAVLGFIYGILLSFAASLIFPGSFIDLAKVGWNEYVPVAVQLRELTFQINAILFLIPALAGFLFCGAFCLFFSASLSFGLIVGFSFAGSLALYNVAVIAGVIFAGSLVGSLISARIYIKLKMARA